MITQDTVSELFSLTPSTILSFYTLDLSDILSQVDEDSKYFYFYNGLNNNFEDIVWQGQTYIGIPIISEDFGYNSQKPVRPTLRIANLNGTLTSIIKAYGGIEGAKITRKRTMVKYLDAANFPGGNNPYGTPDPNAGFGDDLFVVERKIESNSLVLEYELSIPYDLNQTRYPSNQVTAAYCGYEYRGEGCRYQGLVLTDIDGNYISNVTSARAWRPDKQYNSGVCVYDYDGIILQHYRCISNTTINNRPKDNLFTYWAQINANPWASGTLYESGDIAYVVRSDGRRIYGVSQQQHEGLPQYSGFYNYKLWKHDECGKTPHDCRKRFHRILNFGGFRGTAALPL